MTTYYTDFEVTGRGGFPYDMLRYDRCYPTDTLSAQTMEIHDEWAPDAAMRVKGDRTIKLRCIHSGKQWEPTKARWNSFGWGVTEIHEPRRRD